MKREWPKKMVVACRRTIAAYDKLIKTGDCTKWKSDWGGYGKCLLCKACGTNGWELHCYKCPLGPGVLKCASSTYESMLYVLEADCAKGAVIRVAKARRRYLLRRFRAAGIEVEQ